MNRDEYHTGKIKQIKIEGEELEQYCKNILLEHGIITEDFDIKNSPYHDLYVEMLADDLWNTYFFINNKLYMLLEDNEEDGDYNTKLTENDDGTISFTSRFYNGSSCLKEELNEALIKLDW